MRNTGIFAGAACVVVLVGLGAQFAQQTTQRQQLNRRIRELHKRYMEKLDQGYDLSAVNAAARPLTGAGIFRDLTRAERVVEQVENALEQANRKTGIERLPSFGPIGQSDVYDYRPAIAIAQDGTWWIAWVSWKNGEGDRLFVASGRPGAWSEPVELSDSPGDYLRPSIVVDRSGRPWVFFATRVDGDVEVCYKRLADGRWTERRVVGPNPGPDFNVEAALAPDGRIVAVWQSWRGDSYKIVMAASSAGEMGP
ncbi:MAG: exo-alpha-sialidase, partial [Armatimonadetes bacterium]|nr:exo-alpha-sialidase [Armatimonadota bacterium]